MSDILRHNLNIRDSEEILRVIRRHWTTFFWSYLFTFVFIVGPFFLIVPLFHWGMNGIIIFFAMLSCGVILALRTFVSWFFNACVITTERVIDMNQRGFFDRIVVEALFTKIRDVSFHRHGISQFVFRHASIIVHVDGGGESLYFQHLKNPERIQEIIVKSVEHARRTEQPQELIHRVDA